MGARFESSRVGATTSTFPSHFETENENENGKTENKGGEVTLNCVKSKGESVKKFKSNINFDDCFSVYMQ